MNNNKSEIDKERIEEAYASQEALKKEIESIDEKIDTTWALIQNLKKDIENVIRDKNAKYKSIGEKELLLNDLSKAIDDTEKKVKVSKVLTMDYLGKETKIKNDLIKMGADIQNRKARQRRLSI